MVRRKKRRKKEREGARGKEGRKEVRLRLPVPVYFSAYVILSS